MLGLFVLADHHQSGGLVCQPDGGIGCIHRLSARTGRAENIHLDLVGIEFDLHLLGFRQNRHRYRGRMDTPLGFRGRNPLNAVCSTFVLQIAVGPVPFHHGNDFLETTRIGPVAGHDLHLPPAVFRISVVHAEKVAREQGRLIPARAGADLQDDIFGVIGIFRDQKRFQFAFQIVLPGRERFDFSSGKILDLMIAVRQQLAAYLEFVQNLPVIPVYGNNLTKIRVLPGIFRVHLPVGDHGGIAQKAFEFDITLFKTCQSVKQCHNVPIACRTE